MRHLDKNGLRKHLRKARQEFVKQRPSLLMSFTPATSAMFDGVVRSASHVAGYLPFGDEADPIDVMTPLSGQNHALCLPWLAARDTPMLFRAWQPGDPTLTAPGGFQQPLSSEEIIEPDLILLPLVGFDRSGNRLGQGAGYYDRALTLHPDAMRIGIAWSVQEVDQIPADPWDVPLDAILTEAEWIVPTTSRLERGRLERA